MTDKLHLILDIDGTLICSEIMPAYAGTAYDICPNMALKHSNGYIGFGYHRPGLIDFMEECFDIFKTVSLWTAGNEDWLNAFIISLPDEMSDRFSFKWHRDHCQVEVLEEGENKYTAYTKPLTKIWKTSEAKDLEMHSRTTFILDDFKDGCIHNLKNWIPAPYFPMYDPKDKVLFKYVLPKLKALSSLQ